MTTALPFDASVGCCNAVQLELAPIGPSHTNMGGTGERPTKKRCEYKAVSNVQTEELTHL